MSEELISLCMITKNEESCIKDALLSVKSVVHEIIVVDHNSSDLTVHIANDFGARVFSRKWDDSFANARNYSIEQAMFPNILIMDADEILVSDHEALKIACSKINSELNMAARVEVENKTEDVAVSTWITRLIPNRPEFRYRGRIHEQIVWNNQPPRTWDSSIKIEHSGYQLTEIERKNKTERNLELLLVELSKAPNNPYTLFQIGRTYEQRHYWELARDYYMKSKDFIDEQSRPIYYSTLLLHLSKCLIQLKDWQRFMEIINVAIENYPDYTDLYYMYGVGIIEARNANWFSEIPRVFTNCLIIGEPDGRRYETIRGVGSYLAHYNLGLYYELLGNTSLSLFHYTQSHEMGFALAKSRMNRFQ